MSDVRENETSVDGSTRLLDEEEMAERAERPTSIGGNDGTEEKLVAEDGKLSSNREASEVKFISADSQNGDAKIDIENVKVAFAGMGKDELMKFANDPFWIKMRWFLFIFFWVLWVGMLVGAIAIIVLAPKCAAPAPLKWWEQTPVYAVNLKTFMDGDKQDGIGDIRGLHSKLEYIESLGVKGVIVSSLLKSSETTANDYVEDFKDIDPVYGTLQDFKNLTKAMKSKGMHLIMSFIPNHTSSKHPWFVKSEQGEEPYKDYYIWSKGATDDKGNRVEPNNWVSVQSGSAWTFSSTRNEYYLHQFHEDQPDLNFRNEAVIEEFKDILRFWLKQGVSGFEFNIVEYLFEDSELKDEAINHMSGDSLGQYNFLQHTHTVNLPDGLDVLGKLKEVFHNISQRECVFSVVCNVVESGCFPNNENVSSTVDILRNHDLFSSLKMDFTAKHLSDAIDTWKKEVSNDTRVYWELGSSAHSRVTTRLSSDVVDGLNAVILLLPGTPITYYGDELGMADAVEGDARNSPPMSWMNTTNAGFSTSENISLFLSENYYEKNVENERVQENSHLKLYTELVKIRKSPSIMYGNYESTVFNNTVFAYTRFKSGNPGYLVAFNPGDEEVLADFKPFKNMADELTVHLKSSNIKTNLNKYPSHQVPIPAKGMFVLTFVPKQA